MNRNCDANISNILHLRLSTQLFNTSGLQLVFAGFVMHPVGLETFKLLSLSDYAHRAKLLCSIRDWLKLLLLTIHRSVLSFLARGTMVKIEPLAMKVWAPASHWAAAAKSLMQQVRGFPALTCFPWGASHSAAPAWFDALFTEFSHLIVWLNISKLKHGAACVHPRNGLFTTYVPVLGFYWLSLPCSFLYI